MEEFIRNITDQIRCGRARSYVARELSDHILDQAAAYEQKGMEHDEAVTRAVQEMGDPVEIGVELDRIHRPQTDIKLILMVLLFSLGGILIQYILPGNFVKSSEVNDSMIFLSQFGRQCLILLIAFIVMTGMYFLDYSIVGRYAVAIYVSMTVVFLVSSLSLMRVNGRVPVLSMLVYLYVPAYAGILYRLRGKGYSAIALGIAAQFLTIMLVRGFSSTLHAAVGVCLMQIILLFLAIYKNWFKVNKKTAIIAVVILLVILPAVGILFRIAGNPDSFRMSRIRAWLNPSEDPQGAGYIYWFIRDELSRVRLIGAAENSAFLKGESMIWPAERSDPFIFLQLVCTYGILAGVIVVLAFTALIVRAFHIVRHQKNQLGFMISAACFMVFLINCVEGILINSGHYPVTSMQFPFLSSGVGATITYAVLIGLMLSIYRNERIITDGMVTGRPAWRLSVKLERK